MPLSKTKIRVLIVDDEPQILEVFSALLNGAGYIVDQADNALAAMAAVVRSMPDIVLADIRMPIVSGLGLAHELKSHSDTRHIPVIAVTGYDREGSREAALAAGYNDYLTKPIDPRLFPEQVASLLQEHGTTRQAGPAGKKKKLKPKARARKPKPVLRGRKKATKTKKRPSSRRR